MGDLIWVEMRNHVIEDVTSHNAIMRHMIFDMKQFLVGAPGYETNGTAGVWTVISSCDGATNVANSDLWLTATNIVRSDGTHHSWIRLSNATLGLEMVLNTRVDYGSDDRWPLYITFASPSFNLTAGDATTRPTGRYEWTYGMSVSDNQMILSGPNGGLGGYKLHGLLATTGDFWLCMSFDGYNNPLWALGACKLLDTKPGDLYPQVTSYSGIRDENQPAYPYGFDKQQWYPSGGGNSGEVGDAACIRGRTYAGIVAGTIFNGSAVMGAVVPTIGFHSSGEGYISPRYPGISPLDYNSQPDPADGLFPTFPVIIGVAGGLYHSFKGRWPDLLLAGYGLPTNTPYPNIGAQTALKLNYTWVPFTQRLSL